MDWNQIREDYITDETTSYRKLAAKYGVGLNALTKHAKDEDWVGQRKQIKDKTITKSIEILSDQQAGNVTKYGAMIGQLTDKLMAAIDAADPRDTTSIRRLTASLCDLKELLGVKSDADSREQEARIANLKKQADKDDNGEAPTLVVEGLPEEFKV